MSFSCWKFTHVSVHETIPNHVIFAARPATYPTIKSTNSPSRNGSLLALIVASTPVIRAACTIMMACDRDQPVLIATARPALVPILCAFASGGFGLSGQMRCFNRSSRIESSVGFLLAIRCLHIFPGCRNFRPNNTTFRARHQALDESIFRRTMRLLTAGRRF